MSDNQPDTPQFNAGWRAIRQACFDAGIVTTGSDGFFRIPDQHAMAEFLRGARDFADLLDRKPEPKPCQ